VVGGADVFVAAGPDIDPAPREAPVDPPQLGVGRDLGVPGRLAVDQFAEGAPPAREALFSAHVGIARRVAHRGIGFPVGALDAGALVAVTDAVGAAALCHGTEVSGAGAVFAGEAVDAVVDALAHS